MLDNWCRGWDSNPQNAVSKTTGYANSLTPAKVVVGALPQTRTGKRWILSPVELPLILEGLCVNNNNLVGVVGFEPTTTHVQDEYDDQAALHPEFRAIKNPLTLQSEG